MKEKEGAAKLGYNDKSNLIDVLRISRKRPVCCISVLTEKLQEGIDLEALTDASFKMETRISDYDYIPMTGSRESAEGYIK